MNNLNQLLQISANLYRKLANLPSEGDRDAYIEKVNQLLDERGDIMAVLQQNHFVFDEHNKSHQMLAELDKGIRERLEQALGVIKEDLRELQNAKKNEKQYINPYASVEVMDGRYYDKKN